MIMLLWLLVAISFWTGHILRTGSKARRLNMREDSLSAAACDVIMQRQQTHAMIYCDSEVAPAVDLTSFEKGTP